MCALQLFLSVDPSLGRVDYGLLSDQTLMEMLLDGFDNETKKEYQDNDGMYLDVYKWQSIKCDDDDRVSEIQINSRHVSGSLALCYIPPKVTVINISTSAKSGLTGSVDFAHLPKGMQKLMLPGNQLAGEIDLTRLPDGMGSLDLRNNQLTGEIDLTQLPEGMVCFSLEYNQFTGEIDLMHLPGEMGWLLLENNQLTGEIDLTHLPDGMRALRLSDNQLSGEIDLTHLPEEMDYIFLKHNLLTGPLVIGNLPPRIFMIDVQGNHFNAIAVVSSKVHAGIFLQESGVTSVVDESGNKVDMKRFLE